MEPIQGYTIVQDTLCQGVVIAWKTDGPDGIEPVIWNTIEEARKELIGEYIDHLQEYMLGNREWEDTDTGGPDEWVAEISITERGELWVWDEQGNEIIDTTLEHWRKSL